MRIGFVVGLVVLSSVSLAFGQPVRARQADAFVDSVGVNVHLHYYDTAYADFEGKVLPSLAELGVRHIRDGICPVEDGTKPERLRTLFTQLGVRATLVVDPRCESVAEAATYVQTVLGTGLLAALEGPNEYDLSGDSDWAEVLRAYQAELYSTLKSVPATAAVPVIGPSVTSEKAAKTLGDVTRSADIVNLHSYYSFRPPETQGWGDNGYGSLGWQLGAVAQPLGASVADGPPLIVTETGYHNVYQNPELAGLPEAVTAAYLPRLLLNHFDRGVTRTFIYELLDEWDEPQNKEANFGLVRFDGSKKPAFVALRNLLTLLNDPGRAFVPGSLAVELKPDSDTLTWTLLQKRDGNFYLAVWDNAAMFDPEADPEIVGAEQTVTLSFGEPVTAVSRVLPNGGVTWEHLSLTGSTLELERRFQSHLAPYQHTSASVGSEVGPRLKRPASVRADLEVAAVLTALEPSLDLRNDHTGEGDAHRVEAFGGAF